MWLCRVDTLAASASASIHCTKRVAARPSATARSYPEITISDETFARLLRPGWSTAAKLGRPIPVAIALLVATVLVHLPSLSQRLLEVHPFRQTHTAWTALIFHEQGIDLLHPMLPTVGLPFILPWEFPLFEALGSLVMGAGIGPDTAMRTTGLAMFLLTAIVTWRLASHLAGDVAGLATLLAFVLTPLGLLWSRTSMIEYMATAAAVVYVFAALLWFERRDLRLFALSMGFGAVAMLVKGTTGSLYVVPIVVLGIYLWTGRTSSRDAVRVLPFAVALVVVPLALGIAWSVYADSVKDASVFTAGLTTLTSPRAWYFGTLAQKLDPAEWWPFLTRTQSLVLGGAAFLWAPLASGAARITRHRAFFLALLAGAPLGPLIFTNQYFENDYYLAALSPIVALGVGLAAAWLWRERQTLRARGAGAALAFAWVATIALQGRYWLVQFDPQADVQGDLPIAAAIDRASTPDDLVVLTGRDYFDPAAMYYAQRRGLVMPLDGLRDALGSDPLAELRRLGYDKVLDCPYGSTDCPTIVDLHQTP